MSVSWTDSSFLSTQHEAWILQAPTGICDEHSRETFLESLTERSAIPAGKRLLMLKERMVVEGL